MAALWCFVVAAIAGVMMRMMGAGLLSLEGLDFSNLRRAHSHLMLFSWVTPALAALIAAHAGPTRLIRWSIRAMLVLGLLSFPCFLIWGYQSAELGAARVPLSIIVSTASMFAWYAFAVGWVRIRDEVERSTNELAVRAWDGAIVLLVVGSGGAWARGIFTGLGVESLFLQNGAVEFFLTSYADGYLFIGVLGLVVARYGVRFGMRASAAAMIVLTAMIVVTPLEFLAFLPVEVVPTSIRPIGAVAAVCVGIATLYFAVMTRNWLAGTFLAVLGGGKLLLFHPDVATEVLALGLRVPYLHVLLLGFVTITLIEEAQKCWPSAIGRGPVAIAVIVSLVALLPTTGLWPEVLSREIALSFTAFASTLPIFAVLVVLHSRPTESDRAMTSRNRPSRPLAVGRDARSEGAV